MSLEITLRITLCDDQNMAFLYDPKCKKELPIAMVLDHPEVTWIHSKLATF